MGVVVFVVCGVLVWLGLFVLTPCLPGKLRSVAAMETQKKLLCIGEDRKEWALTMWWRRCLT